VDSTDEVQSISIKNALRQAVEEETSRRRIGATIPAKAASATLRVTSAAHLIPDRIELRSRQPLDEAHPVLVWPFSAHFKSTAFRDGARECHQSLEYDNPPSRPDGTLRCMRWLARLDATASELNLDLLQAARGGATD
jgi:hypothetical protein